MQADQYQQQDQLVRGLTHRMNNILSLFHGYLGILLDDKQLDQSTKDGLAKIKEGARAASELMDRTHSLVRNSAVVWREVDLETFVMMVKQSFESLRGPKTTLTFHLEDDLPPVSADAGRLRAALFELVRNGCEATSHGGSVRIEITRDAEQPSHIAIAVVDDGPGIPPELHERVFEPFFTTKKKHSAAGLGLNVATGYVQQIGGALKFSSKPKETRFEIALPAAHRA